MKVIKISIKTTKYILYKNLKIFKDYLRIILQKNLFQKIIRN